MVIAITEAIESLWCIAASACARRWLFVRFAKTGL